MITENIEISAEGLTVSLLAWRRYRRRHSGFVEAVLDLNPGVADGGVFLKPGTVLRVPVVTKPEAAKRAEAIALWD